MCTYVKCIGLLGAHYFQFNNFLVCFFVFCFFVFYYFTAILALFHGEKLRVCVLLFAHNKNVYVGKERHNELKLLLRLLTTTKLLSSKSVGKTEIWHIFIKIEEVNEILRVILLITIYYIIILVYVWLLRCVNNYTVSLR